MGLDNLHTLLESYRYNVNCKESYERNIKKVEKQIKETMKENNIEFFSSPFNNLNATFFNGKLEVFEYNEI